MTLIVTTTHVVYSRTVRWRGVPLLATGADFGAGGGAPQMTRVGRMSRRVPIQVRGQSGARWNTWPGNGWPRNRWLDEGRRFLRRLGIGRSD